MVRLPFLLVLLATAACSDRDRQSQPASAAEIDSPLTVDEERTIIARKGEAGVVLRSGPAVPAQLPPGFSPYPGAKIVSNTVVEGNGGRRSLLVMETAQSIDEVMAFYRTQARSARLDVEIDLGGDECASLGGHLKGGGDLTISARRARGLTRIELACTHGPS